MPDGSRMEALQRSRGEGRVSLVLRQGRASVGQLRQAGSAKVMLPRSHGPVPEVVFLNTSGGLTGGDHIRFSMDVGPGCDVVGTTQTAERAYASAGGAARLDVDLSVGQGGRLDWLPQETILFQDSALQRRTSVDLAGDATLILSEMLVLGRAAMGETITRLALSDWREVRRAGRPVLLEPFSLQDAALGHSATTGEARAMATVALITQGAEDALIPVRSALAAQAEVDAAASAWDGKCVLRLMAADALPLKRAVAAVMLVLRAGRPLPRVWQI
ncbi:urease accessory protein UreD [Halodurantibacterium flavum]|uniref:Urease accessory protein UreD n=1 Tax=Halodurantibacterium flavum TaxID=1382802 RepID=A0ABW4S4X6_9RHOB